MIYSENGLFHVGKISLHIHEYCRIIYFRGFKISWISD